MPERLSLTTVALCAVLGGAAFGGAYALARDEPAPPAPALASPTTIQLEDEPIGELRRVSPLPALIVPPPRPEPTQTTPVVEETPPVVPTATPEVPVTPAPTSEPTPTPTPTPKPPAPAQKPLTFDDSG